MTTTLITGGNKGLGLETARRLVEAGHDVWLAARDPERGAAAAAEVGARFVRLDVTDEASVTAAAEEVRTASGVVDVLINNAGISGPMAPEDTTPEDVRDVLDVNVVGVVRVTRAFLPLVQAAEAGSVVNVSSGLGSIGIALDRESPYFELVNLGYTASKSALNMLTAQYSKGYPDVRFNVVDPGYTATDFNDNQGPQTVQEGTDRAVEVALLGGDAPTGTYSDRSGPLPW